MKIDEKQYPPLSILNNKEGYDFDVSLQDNWLMPKSFIEMIKSHFYKQFYGYKGEIKYISSTLFDPMNKAWDKLMVDDALIDFNDEGIILLPDNQCTFYKIKYIRESEERFMLPFYQIELFHFWGNILIGYVNEDDQRSVSFGSWIKHGVANNADASFESGKDTFKQTLLIATFLRYADIEVKHLPPSRQIYEGVNCLYNNKTKNNIQIIDSTWFTTLVKSDGFNVRGHFRLQPHGEGLSKRKLVWINEFQKYGYTRVAKKEHSE